jgi:hypothetical protein
LTGQTVGYDSAAGEPRYGYPDAVLPGHWTAGGGLRGDCGWERLVIGGVRRVQWDGVEESWERDIEVDDGVETADEMDREVWFVTGTPSGEALVRAVAEVLDDLAEQTWAYIRG